MPAFSKRHATYTHPLTIPAGTLLTHNAYVLSTELDALDEVEEAVENNNSDSVVRGLNHYSGVLWFDDVPAEIWITDWSARVAQSRTEHTISGTGTVKGASFQFTGLDVNKDLNTLDYTVDAAETTEIQTDALPAITSSNVTYQSPGGVFLNRDGAFASLKVTLPAGFGWAYSPTSDTLNAFIELPQLELDADLKPKIPPTINETRYYAEETKPVMLGASSLVWHPEDARFELTPNGTMHYVREDELSELDTRADNEHIPERMADKPSNERYYRQASLVAGQTITVRATAAGAAEMSVEFDVSSGSYTTHFPYGVEIFHNGPGDMVVVDDLVQSSGATSYLGGIPFLAMEYDQGCPGDCPGSDFSEFLTMEPTNDELTFTGNGGLVGSGDVSGIGRLAWGYFESAGDPAQSVEGLTDPTFLMSGHFLLGDEMTTGLEGEDGPGLILFSGVQANDERTPERPWQPAYEEGLADYPGINFRDNGDLQGVSVIGGEPFSVIEFGSRTKYYARPSGVSGIHEAEQFQDSGTIYGYPFNFSSYSLSYLSSINKDSRTAGETSVPYPSDFGVAFERLMLSCLGDLETAELASPEFSADLAYWTTPMQAFTLRFERNATCEPGQGYLTMDIQTWADHVDPPLPGTFGWRPDGRLLNPSDNIADVTSRLTLPDTIPVDGPRDEQYTMFPVNEAYLNSYDAANLLTETGSGYVSLAGTLTVPFFEDLMVHVHTGAGTGDLSGMYMMGGWPNMGWSDRGTHFFTHPQFDFEHRGYPPWGPTEDEYRDPDNDTYRVRARRTWLGVVEFDYPLDWSPLLRSFESPETVENDLLVVSVEHQVGYLSAENSELVFGAQYGSIPNINLTNFTLNKIDEATGVGQAFTDSVGDEVLGTLEKGLDSLDRLLADITEDLMSDIFATAVDPVIDNLYDELESNYAQGTDWFTDSVDRHIRGFGGGGAIPNQHLDRAFTHLATGVDDAIGVVDEVDAALVDVLRAVDAVMEGVEVDPATGEDLEEAVDGLMKLLGNGRYPVLEELGSVLFRVVASTAAEAFGPEDLNEMILEALEDIKPVLEEIRARLEEVRGKVAEIRQKLTDAQEFEKELRQAVETVDIGGLTDDIADRINAKFEDLDDEFSPFEEYSAEELKKIIRDQVTAEFLASEVPANITRVLRTRLYDVDAKIREAIDSLFQRLNKKLRDIATDYLPDVDEEINGVIGDMNDKIGTGQIDGYAHIRGDSLQRLRLDGDFQWKVPKELEFEAFLLIESIDTSGSGGCGFDGGTANEVTIGANRLPCDWLASELSVDIATKFTIHNGAPVGMAGSFEFAEGGIEFESFEVPELGAAVAFGARENYLAAQVRAIFSSVEVEGGVFFGRTCTLHPIEVIDPEVADLLGAPPFSGAYVFGEGYIPVVDFSCMLRVSAGVGAGFFYFVEGPTYGAKLVLGAKGEALCAVEIGGEVVLVGVKSGGVLRASGTGRLYGRAGKCPVCVTFNKSVGFTYKEGKFDADL